MEWRKVSNIYLSWELVRIYDILYVKLIWYSESKKFFSFKGLWWPPNAISTISSQKEIRFFYFIFDFTDFWDFLDDFWVLKGFSGLPNAICSIFSQKKNIQDFPIFSPISPIFENFWSFFWRIALSMSPSHPRFPMSFYISNQKWSGKSDFRCWQSQTDFRFLIYSPKNIEWKNKNKPYFLCGNKAIFYFAKKTYWVTVCSL